MEWKRRGKGKEGRKEGSKRVGKRLKVEKIYIKGRKTDKK